MTEIASAFVSVLPSARGFAPKLNSQVQGPVAGVGKKLGISFGKVFAAAAGGIAAVGVGKFLKGAISSAGDLEQSVGAIDAVFKGSAKQMKKWSRQAAVSAGLSRNEYNELATVLGAQLKNGGTALDELGKKTNDLIGVGADLSSMFGGTTRDAVEALSSALKGERDPIERYGVTLKQVSIDAEASALGFKKVGTTFDSNAQQAATLSLIMKQTADAQGNFSRETDTLQHQQQVLGARFENIKTTIGTALLPVATRFFGYLNEKGIPAARIISKRLREVAALTWAKLSDAAVAVKTFFQNGKGHEALAASVEAIRNAAGRIKSGLSAGADALDRIRTTVSQIDFSNLDSEQVGEFIGKAVAAGIEKIPELSGKLYTAFTKLLKKVDWVGLGIEIGKQVPALLLGLATGIVNFDFGSLLTGIKEHWGEILMGVLAVALAPSKFVGPLAKILGKIPFVGRFLAAAVTWVNQLGGKMKGFGGDLVRSFGEGFGRVRVPGAGFIKNVLSAIKGLPGAIRGFFVSLQTRIGVWALDAFSSAGRGARNATGKLLSFVGGLPGKILRAIGDLSGLLLDVGSDVVGGLARGIRNAASSVLRGAVKYVTDQIPGPIKKFLKIKSPSRVMMAIGANITSGLAVGIKSTKGEVRNALRDVLSSVRDQIQSVRDSIVSAFSGDLFSAETGKDFLANLASTNGTVGKLKTAFNRLLAWGWQPEALSALFGSGNSALILDLASSQATAKAAAQQYQAVTTGLNQLGLQVGREQYNPETDVQIKTLKQLLKAVEHVGIDVSDALNTVSKNARRKRGKKS